MNIELISKIGIFCLNTKKCTHDVEYIDKDFKICKEKMLGSKICKILKTNNSLDLLGTYLNNHFTQNGFLNNPNIKNFLKIELINISKNNYAAKINYNLNS